MTIQFHSEERTVTHITRKSNARYAVGVHRGDVISFKLAMPDTQTHYSIPFEMYVNGEYKTDVLQGEIYKVLGRPDSIFQTEINPVEAE